MKVHVSKHADARYAERCPDGPGLLAELATIRRPTKRQWHKIHSIVRTHKRARIKFGELWEQRIWVTDWGNVIVTSTLGEKTVIVTVYPMEDRARKAA